MKFPWYRAVARATALVCLCVTSLAPMWASPAAARASPRPQAATSQTSAFPLTLTTAGGKVTIPKKPTRILCLSASATQMLYALGAGKQVVGVDKYSTWPPGAPRTKFTGYETSAEDYLYLHPDLVIFAFQEGKLVQQLKLLGIPALVLPPATNFQDVYKQINELAAATGHVAAGQRLDSSLAAYLRSYVRKAGDKARGDTYYIELSPDYYTATSGTFIGAEFSLFGMRDIADAAAHGSAYPQISAEYLLKANPDYVFLADTVCCHQTPASFSRRPAFALLSAVKHHHVYGVNDAVASEWGPHTIEEFVAFIARVVSS